MNHEVTMIEGDTLYVQFERLPGLRQGFTYRQVLEAALQTELNRLRAESYAESYTEQEGKMQALQPAQNIGFDAGLKRW